MPVIPRRPKVKFRFRSSRDRQSRSRGFGWSEFILEYALASCSRGTESPMSMAAGAAIGHPSMRLAVFKNSADRLKAVLQTFRYPGRQLLVVPASAGSLPGESHTSLAAYASVGHPEQETNCGSQVNDLLNAVLSYEPTRRAKSGHPNIRLAGFENSADRLKVVLQTFRYPCGQLLVVPASAGSFGVSGFSLERSGL